MPGVCRGCVNARPGKAVSSPLEAEEACNKCGGCEYSCSQKVGDHSLYSVAPWHPTDRQHAVAFRRTDPWEDGQDRTTSKTSHFLPILLGDCCYGTEAVIVTHQVALAARKSIVARAGAEINTGKRCFRPAQGPKECLRTLTLSDLVQEVGETRPEHLIQAPF